MVLLTDLLRPTFMHAIFQCLNMTENCSCVDICQFRTANRGVRKSGKNWKSARGAKKAEDVAENVAGVACDIEHNLADG